jgi:alanine racemase
MNLRRRAFLSALAASPLLGIGAEAAPHLSTLEDGRMLPSNAAWLEIDAQAFAANIRAVRRAVGAGVELCAVMKGDAYGHGIGLLIPSVIAEGIRTIGITSNDEARIARAKGYCGKIVRLMTAPTDEVEDALPLDLEEIVGNAAVARLNAAAALRHGRNLRVHLMLNSGGMSRNGLELSTAGGREDARDILAQRGLEIAGLMTHYPLNDPEDMRAGLARFKDDAGWIITQGRLDRRRIILHTANSWATMGLPETRLDMVRPGGALYGDTDTVTDASALRPVMALKTRVAAVNAYPKGNTVTYGRTATLQRDSLLANLPVGYSDGYDRRYSNLAEVLVRGRRAPVIGRVTMNTTMIDVTDIAGVSPGDEVVLYGSQGNEEIKQGELEKITNSIFISEYTLWGNSLPKVLKN